MKTIIDIRRRETARQIREAMEVKGVSKIALARMLGKSPSAVTSWLSGTHNFTSDLLAEISEALETQITGVDSHVDGYVVSQLKESFLREPATGGYTIDSVCLPRAEFEALERKAEAAGVSLIGYVEFVLGREARTEAYSESMRTEAFLADCAGAWSGSEFDGVEEELMSTRTSREVVQI